MDKVKFLQLTKQLEALIFLIDKIGHFQGRRISIQEWGLVFDNDSQKAEIVLSQLFTEAYIALASQFPNRDELQGESIKGDKGEDAPQMDDIRDEMERLLQQIELPEVKTIETVKVIEKQSEPIQQVNEITKVIREEIDIDIESEIVRSNEAIRNSLELFEDEKDKLKMSAIAGLDGLIDSLRDAIQESRKQYHTCYGISAQTARKIAEEVAAGGGGGHTIQNDGSDLPQKDNLNFIGDNITATDNGDTTDVTVDVSDKSDVGHAHDDRYYTETETDSLLSGKSDTGHTHDDRYYTETETDTLLSGKSDTGHTHDDRYYTETEADSLLADKMDDVDSIVATDDQVSIQPTATFAPYAEVNDEPTENLITNPKFEIDLTGWSSVLGATLTRDTGHTYGGSSASMKISTTGVNQGAKFTIPVTAGEMYIFSFFVKGAVGGEEVAINMAGNGAGATDTQYVYYRGELVTDGFQRYSIAHTANVSDTTMTLTIDSGAYGSAAQDIYVALTQAELKSEGVEVGGDIQRYASAYCDGDMGVGHAWTGTANASTSTRAGGKHILASIDEDNYGSFNIRKDGSIEGRVTFDSREINTASFSDERFSYEFLSNQKTYLKTTGKRNGTVRIYNRNDGIGLYVQSESTSQQVAVIDGGATTSGSIFTVYSPEDIPAMIAAGGLFLEFTSKGQNAQSTFDFAPNFFEMGHQALPYLERFTYYGGGNGTTTQDSVNTGTVSWTNATKTITGSGTTFLADYKAGDSIVMQNTSATYNLIRIVDVVVSDTEITTTGNMPASKSGKGHRGYVEQYRPAQIQLEGPRGNHARSSTADFFHTIFPSGADGQIHVHRSTSRGDTTGPTADGDGDALVTKKDASTSTQTFTDTAQNTFVTHTVPAGVLIAGKAIRIKWWGDIDANATTSTFQWKIRFGGSTVCFTNVQEIGSGGVTDISGEATIIGHGDAENQKAFLEVHGKDTTTTTAENYTAIEVASSSIDARVEQDLTLTVTQGDALSTTNIRAFIIELI